MDTVNITVITMNGTNIKLELPIIAKTRRFWTALSKNKDKDPSLAVTNLFKLSAYSTRGQVQGVGVKHEDMLTIGDYLKDGDIITLCTKPLDYTIKVIVTINSAITIKIAENLTIKDLHTEIKLAEKLPFDAKILLVNVGEKDHADGISSDLKEEDIISTVLKNGDTVIMMFIGECHENCEHCKEEKEIE